MNRWIHSVGATLGVVAMVLGVAGPAAASTKELEDQGKVNVVFDAMILRPLGLATTALGAALFAVPVAPLVGMTRPKDLGKPLEFLVLRPARYTFQDPLGHH